MNITSRHIAKIDKNEGLKISVLEYGSGKFELAVLYARDKRLNEWDVDYSIFDDVISVDSMTEVYGAIQNQIAPAYYDEFGADLF